MKTIQKIIVILCFLLVTNSMRAQKIYVTQFEGNDVVKVFVTQFEGGADLKVFVTQFEAGATGNKGKWYYTKHLAFADVKVCFVRFQSFADVKVCFVRFQSFAGWNNSSKKHLFDKNI